MKEWQPTEGIDLVQAPRFPGEARMFHYVSKGFDGRPPLPWRLRLAMSIALGRTRPVTNVTIHLTSQDVPGSIGGEEYD